MRSTLVTFVLCATVPTATVVVPAAYAQPRSDADKKKAAKEYVDAGLAAQNAGDYDTALVFYGKAYELVPHPVLLFNMAQAHRLALHHQLAIDFYKKYLEADPKGPQVKQAKEFITALEVQMASEAAKAEEARQAAEAAKAEEARQAREADAARKAEEARRAEETRKAEEARKAQEGGGTGGPVEPEPHDGGGKPGGGMRIAGLASAGVGVGAIGVGLFVFGAKAAKLSDELSEPGAVYDPQKISDGEAADKNMKICVGLGGVLVVGGAVVYMLGRKKGTSAEQTTLVPTVSPDGVGLVLSGTLP